METEEKIDARKLSPRELSEKRRIAMKLRDKGMPNKEVAQIVGISAQTISSYYTQYKKNGNKIFIVKNAGRPKKSGKRLSDEQEQHIVKMLVSTNPSQLQFKFALWTREAVRELILRELDIDMPISTVGDYLARWQLASKKPIKRAYERKDALTKAWLEDIYPSIKREAKKERADIWWCDETACVSLPTNLKGYAPIGSKNKPILTHPAKKFKISMISAITNTGKSMFALYDESIKIDSFIDFCQKVIDSNSGKKVYLIVDNLRVHHAKLVKAWEEERKDKIKLFYLPPYSPEYNPDEYLNQHYKRNANKNNIPLNQKELRANTEKYIKDVASNPKLIASFFQHQSVRYAG
jgi:transposase